MVLILSFSKALLADYPMAFTTLGMAKLAIKPNTPTEMSNSDNVKPLFFVWEVGAIFIVLKLFSVMGLKWLGSIASIKRKGGLFLKRCSVYNKNTTHLKIALCVDC